MVNHRHVMTVTRATVETRSLSPLAVVFTLKLNLQLQGKVGDTGKGLNGWLIKEKIMLVSNNCFLTTLQINS